MPSIRCERCHAVCGQRRICVVCNKRICFYCASDWKTLKRKACAGLCARTAYARLKNPPRPAVHSPLTNQGAHRKGNTMGVPIQTRTRLNLMKPCDYRKNGIGCPRKRKAIARYCEDHWDRLSTTGHLDGRLISRSTYRPLQAHALQYITAH